MVYFTNNPSLSEAFKNEEVQQFFLQYLTEFEENPYLLKEFLIDGAQKTFDKQMKIMAKSFRIVERPNAYRDDGFYSVERVLDGEIFSLGDLVFDEHAREHGDNNKYKISRLYEDDRGLHVRLDVDNNGSITWRDLSRINHK